MHIPMLVVLLTLMLLLFGCCEAESMAREIALKSYFPGRSPDFA